MANAAAAFGSHAPVIRRFVRTFLIPVLLIGSAVGVSTSETTLYGPATYVRQTGAPVTITNTFRVAGALPAAPPPGGDYCVSSADITVDGLAHLSPNDFTGSQPNGFLLIRSLELPAGTHSIAVQLRSKP